MKATGIVRRVDELGRIVIPKELRRVMRIKEGDELEIYTSENAQLVLKRYSTLGNLREHADEYASAVANTLERLVLISDTNEIIAAAGAGRMEYEGKRLSYAMIDLINKREEAQFFEENLLRITPDGALIGKSELILPIIAGGDVYGALVVISEEKAVSPLEKKVAENAVAFLRLNVIRA